MDFVTGNFSTTVFPIRITESPKVSVWIPITVILSLAIFSAIMVLCSNKFKKMCRKNLRNDQGLPVSAHSVQMTFSTEHDRNTVPETPPPAYASLERQFSFVSHISQNSSQIEIPPDYDDVSQVTTSSSSARELVLQALRNTNVVDDPATSSRTFCRSISEIENRDLSKRSLGSPLSSSVLHTYMREDNGNVEPISSIQMNACIPDVVMETAPKIQKIGNHGDDNEADLSDNLQSIQDEPSHGTTTDPSQTQDLNEATTFTQGNIEIA